MDDEPTGLASPGDSASRLAAFIRSHEVEILAEWELAVRTLPVARDLERPALIDHIPDLLERIADMAAAFTAGETPTMPREIAERHAVERLDEGFDLDQVVAEFAVLRDCVMRQFERSQLPRDHVADLRILNRSIDRAISESVKRYTGARDRALQALDRIATAALDSRDLDDLLGRLLRVLMETTPAIDTAAIFIREGDRLRMRAAVGLEEDVAAGFSVAIGEGFTGAIAAEALPHELRAAATAESVLSPAIRKRGVRALFGVPLVDGATTIGVAHVGSLTAHELSNQDRRLVVAMANRATAAINQHMLREAAESRARELARTVASLDALLESPSVGFGFIDPGLRYLRVNDALATINGRSVAEHLGHSVREVLGDAVADVVEPMLLRVMAGEPVVDAEFSAAPPSTPDRVRDFLANYFPVRTADGSVLGIGAVILEITERKQIESLVRHREEQLRLALEATRLGTWEWDLASGAIERSDENRAQLGLRLDAPATIASFDEVIDPADRARFDAALEGALADRSDYRIEYRVRDHGDVRWIASCGRVMVGADGTPERVIGTTQDITDRKRAEEEQRFLAAASATLASSLDHRETLKTVARLAVPMFADWCIVDLIEDGALKRVAIVHSDPSKVALAERYSVEKPPDPEARVGVPGVIRTGAPEVVADVQIETFLPEIVDDERRRILRELGLRSYAMLPLAARDRTLGVITFVSARPGRYGSSTLELLLELARRAAIAIDNARLHDELLRAVTMRERMLAIVSHDLKSPLNTVQLSAQEARSGVEPGSRADRHLARIERSVQRMTHLIGDLLDMASLTAGRLAVVRTAEDADAIVSEVIDFHEPVAQDKGIELRRDTRLEGVRVSCDRHRILQVFANLVGNALKFCEEGCVVTISADVLEHEVRFAVRDNGAGVAAEDLPHLFEPYWSGKRHRRIGNGLGLYITRGIIEANGGRIWVESERGAGATFFFTLPLA